MILVAIQVVPGLTHYLTRKDTSIGADIDLARSLQARGLKRGDLVATVGDAKGALWAHFAGLSVAAEVWSADASQFWSSSSSEQDAILHAMVSTGAKAVIWQSGPTESCPKSWSRLTPEVGCIFSPTTSSVQSIHTSK
jgi:hypothetical protein